MLLWAPKKSSAPTEAAPTQERTRLRLRRRRLGMAAGGGFANGGGRRRLEESWAFSLARGELWCFSCAVLLGGSETEFGSGVPGILRIYGHLNWNWNRNRIGCFAFTQRNPSKFGSVQINWKSNRSRYFDATKQPARSRITEVEGYVPIRTNRLELVFVEGYIPILGIISRFLLWIKNAHQNPSLFIIETIQHRFCASILGFHDMNSFYNSLNIMKSLDSTPIEKSKG
jgi:hypothetical protein